MKRHGLWQWHRCLQQHATGKTLEWWGKDIQRANDIVSAAFCVTHVGNQTGEFAKYVAIVRCAHRYMRRYGIQKTAGNYTDICERISDRGGFAYRSLSAALSYVCHTRRKASITYVNEFTRPKSKANWPIYRLEEEIKKRKQAREERELQAAIERQKKCFVCNKHDAQKRRWLNDLFYEKALDRQIPFIKEHYGLQICWSCWMRLRKLQKRWNEAEELRLINNRYKRKIYESTKNHAGTS